MIRIKPRNNFPNMVRNFSAFGITVSLVVLGILFMKDLFKDFLNGIIYDLIKDLDKVLAFPIVFIMIILAFIFIVSLRFIKPFKFDNFIPSDASGILGADLIIYTDTGFDLELEEELDKNELLRFIRFSNKYSKDYKYSVMQVSRDHMGVSIKAQSKIDIGDGADTKNK